MVNLTLLQDFIVEAAEHLDEMESSLLQLESDPGNKDLLNDIFRSIHTIKGAAQFTGIDKISKLSHTLENLLDMLRVGVKKLNPAIVDTLIESKDRIALLTSELEVSGAETSDIDDLLSQIKKLSEEGEGSNPSDESSKKVETENFIKDLPFEEEEIVFEAEDFSEEHDQELFTIFIKQLTEVLSLLINSVDSISAADDKGVILNRCIEGIKSLQSAANYMEYEKLTRFYKNWCGQIENAKHLIENGFEANFDFMNDNMEKILGAFPQLNDAVVEQAGEMLSNDSSEKRDEDPFEAFTSIDALESMAESSAAPINHSGKDDAAEPNNSVFSEKEPVDLTKEDYSEEFDEELSDIFVSQLTENLSLLRNKTASLAASQSKNEILDRCLETIKSLQAAANYMGYEKLTLHYKKWCLDIQKAQRALSAKEGVSLAFMDAYIDQIIDVFPRIKEKVSERKPSAVNGKDSDDFSEDLFTSIDDLEAMSDPAEAENLFPGDDSGFSLGNSLEADTLFDIENENYTEEFDKELYAIFIKQLRENLAFLGIEADSLRTATNKEDILTRCYNSIKNLQSAANYMGYEKLTGFYKNWCDAIEKAKKRLASGDKVSFGFMNEHIDKLYMTFPRISEEIAETTGTQSIEKDLEDAFTSIDELETMSESIDGLDATPEDMAGFLTDTEKNTGEPAGSAPTKESAGTIQSPPTARDDTIDTETADADLFDRLSTALDESDSSPSHDMEAEDTELFAKLSDAFDFASGQPAISDSEPMDDVLAEMLFSGDDEIQQKSTIASKNTVPENQLSETKSVEKPSVPSPPPDIEPLSETPPPFHKPVIPAETDTEDKSHPNGAAETSASDPIEADQADADEADHVDSDEADQTESESSSETESLTSSEALESKKANPVIEEETQSPLANAESVSKNSPPKKPLKADAQPGTSDIVKSPPKAAETNQERPDEAGKKVFRQSVRVDADKIDSLINQVGELVVSRAFFVQLLEDMKLLQQEMKIDHGVNERAFKSVKELSFKLGEATVALSRVSNDLQEGVMKVRMLPISQLFNRYPRLVRDLVNRTDKNVNLEIRGGETELDKMVIEELSDPLIHIIRNAVDHGIEPSDERKQLGKPETGKLILEAYHESGHVIIEITDDGRGMDPERIKSKALAKGFFTEAELDRMPAVEINRITMMPGFSTAEKATQTSGRGVGMDVVRKNIEKLNGTIEIESQTGIQTRMRLKIPLTLAIIPALMVRVGKDLFTVPLATVEETLKVRTEEISNIEGVEVMHLRNATMPIFRLTNLFSIKSHNTQEDNGFFVVVVSSGMQRIGLVVDELLGQEEVVIKPLEDYLREQSGFSGATIIGDGSVSLILDIYELIKMTSDKQAQRHKDQAKKRKRKAPQPVPEKA